MAYEIVWSESAVRDFEGIVDYLSAQWGEKITSRFKAKLANRLNLLSQFPLLHQASASDPRYRRSVLTKQISIIYSVDDTTIFLIRLFDNRQIPESPDV